MKTIDEYILETSNKENISEGGSPAYSFDDVVLVRYANKTKYGLARPLEEQIAIEANKKNDIGVNTPRHLAIKRTEEGEYNYCWVLQEKAKGVCFSNYYYSNNDYQTQLKKQQELLDAPDVYYEKCISDLSELFNMGLELKAKNIFYDKEKAGFIFIDLLRSDPTPVNPNSISDVMFLDKYANFISGLTQISIYDKKASDEEKSMSQELSYKIKTKTFKAMEKVIPNFAQFRRWVLRTYPKELLDFFENNGIEVGDLALTDEDYEVFNTYIANIVNDCIDKISTGKREYWQIETNEIRIHLDLMGMRQAWNIHKDKPVLKCEDYEDEWEYEYKQKRILDNLVVGIFDEKLVRLSQTSTNPYIIQAKNAIDEKKVNEQNKKM